MTLIFYIKLILVNRAFLRNYTLLEAVQRQYHCTHEVIHGLLKIVTICVNHQIAISGKQHC